MTFKTLALTYVLGGLTLLPLLLAAILVPAWLLLPRSVDKSRKPGDGAAKPEYHGYESGKEPTDVIQDEKFTGEGSASGTFAVLRSYQLQTAVAALNARTNNASSTTATGAPDGATETNESVYQSMYRSVFKGNNPPNSLQEQETAASAANALLKKKAGASVYYIVQRHGHLMLYDSPAQLEVRQVISLAHHTISLSDGEEKDETMTDGDLFIKRTAILLTPIDLPNGQLQQQASKQPFHLFSATCSEKEDFYHALLSTRTHPPVPRPLSAEDLIKLQSTLHSSSLTPETRALNAMIGRVFLALYRTPFLEQLVRSKIEKKISRVQKPNFIAALDVQSIDLGSAAPVISNLRLRDLNISGDLTLAFDMRYSGGVKVVISAMAKLDLGTRFKARTVDLVLATSLQRLQGHMLVRIKPPPSNRLWFCFESMPDMEIKVEPVVSQRQITYNFILRAIEERIRAVVGETLVKPNWDDTPFFDTSQQRVRGGIWKTEGLENESTPTSIKKSHSRSSSTPEVLSNKNDKFASMPNLPLDSDESSSGNNVGPDGLSATSSFAREAIDSLKRRSVASLPLDPAKSSTSSGEHAPSPLRPLRSPSFTNPSPAIPSVALAGAEVASVRADDATLQPKRWLSRQSQAQQMKKDAVEAIREMRNRSLLARYAEDSGEPSLSSTPVNEEEDSEGLVEEPENLDEDLPKSRRHSDSPGSSISGASSKRSMTGFGTPPRMDTMRSTTSTATGSSTSAASRTAQQRKNLLAATAAATTAAKNWSWNAISKRTAGSASQNTTGAGSHLAQSASEQQAKGQPIGRGQPLPPPGVPLPGPQKSLWAGSGFGGVSSLRRKPVPPLPPRPRGNTVPSPSRSFENRNELDDAPSLLVVQSPTEEDFKLENSEKNEAEAEDEFGPWSENSGSRFADSQSEAIKVPSTARDKDVHHEDLEGNQTPPTDSNPLSLSTSAPPSLPSPLPMGEEGRESFPLPGPPPLPVRPGRVVEDSKIHEVDTEKSSSTSHGPESPELAEETVPLVDEAAKPDSPPFEHRNGIDAEGEAQGQQPAMKTDEMKHDSREQT